MDGEPSTPEERRRDAAGRETTAGLITGGVGVVVLLQGVLTARTSFDGLGFGVSLVLAISIFVLAIVVLRGGRKPLPAVLPEIHEAVVTGVTTTGTDRGFDLHQIEVRVIGPDRDWSANLGEAIAAESLDRFEVGTRWRVHALPGEGQWVVLATEHEDVFRHGVWLKGEDGVTRHLRVAERPGPGSDLVIEQESTPAVADRPDEWPRQR